MEIRSGHCLCRAVRFETRGAPKWVAFCHCESCRRALSAPVAAFASFRDENVAFSGEAPRTYRSSPAVERAFCGRCGSPIWYRNDDLPEEVHLLLASFEDDRNWRPEKHDFYSEHLPWLVCGDGLPAKD
ncbi:GFA family protein [Pararhizobium haloflavum]|uniref:GFA family protein n=1 Tax=Pararhizobium haloflavum TaxID=2037914 RepID=UPI0012FFF22F|nr:GFA family protein [Pararhizobium haloflavum]